MATPLSQPEPARKKKPPPSLSNAYQKAHRTYVLSSALLASWELIGIELNTKDKWGVELKSPHAVPLVLLAMIVYFGYRLTVEWVQCDEDRRRTRAARIDFRVAHWIAGLALAISLFQYLWHIRVADVLAHVAWLIALGFLSFATGYVLGDLFLRERVGWKLDYLSPFVERRGGVSFVTVMIFVAWASTVWDGLFKGKLFWTLIPVVIGLLLGLSPYVLFYLAKTHSSSEGPSDRPDGHLSQ